MSKIRGQAPLDSLVAAYKAAPDARRKLLVAGAIGPGYSHPEVAQMLSPQPFLRYRPGRLPDNDVQRWFAASDVAVLPYRRGLNMSVLMLAATFGTPVLVRDIPESRYLLDEPWVQHVQGEGAELAVSLRNGEQKLVGRQNIRKAAYEYARERSPERVSARYLAVFLDR